MKKKYISPASKVYVITILKSHFLEGTTEPTGTTENVKENKTSGSSWGFELEQ